ncbi:hydroxymethylglutaryl-CoA reductase, degradative [Tenuibacillus multivorans]|uniref:3-hydroxy-3-methylglutaryl coenzyme A reductase n=1 Tax=Tenuibacillus multivorans TaxID=237069 RepID=A0A1H0BQI1_9BACI|nr:hydroxymethylglutaryl-CoA reductase, degradative [Tenuibacillus multivorans]GEL77072.1 3-hydroxy-3-methylglutaryl-CoA reductase [Tenuibacillus multivorans]SDN47910.1 hydroxymethylglutaryl-CoA reductase [Tenuibacillus multivorans]
MSSRISKFYQLSPQERLDKVSKFSNLTEQDKDMIFNQKFITEQADRMIENVIGTLPIPVGVAVNFKVNHRDVLIPMATEEPSVVAAASNAAKYAYETGGFKTSYTGSFMRAQVQITELNNPYFAMAKVYEHKEEILELCNQQDPTLVAIGGGATDIDLQVIEGEHEKVLVAHLIVNTLDAMGANAVNTMAEACAPFLEEITGGKVVLRILSNLADKRIVRASAVFKDPFNGDKQTLKRFMYGYDLATKDLYRAATHNKGIMNGITSVVLATGNDTRAIEAGAHAYAARNGHYQTLTRFELAENGDIFGTIELPLAVGLVGGATQSHPVAKAVTNILNINSAEELAGIIASVGLAQNFAAIRALATDGIQKGHMKLHARNLAAMAGANDNQIDQVVEMATKEGKFTFDTIKNIVENLQK